MLPRILFAVLGLAIAPTVGGCVIHIDGDDWQWQADHVGSGVAQTETRTVADFRRIRIECSIDLECEIGKSTQLSVTSDDNLLPFIRTEVEGDTLVIELEDGSYDFETDTLVRLVTPGLEGLAINGSSDANLRGLDSSHLHLAVSGSGDVRAQGMTDRLEISISGSGDMQLLDLQAREAKVRISGSGDVELWATEKLDASVSGSGDIQYKGSPRTDLNVSGSGSISQVR